jgi:hypothetical protein
MKRMLTVFIGAISLMLLHAVAFATSQAYSPASPASLSCSGYTAVQILPTVRINQHWCDSDTGHTNTDVGLLWGTLHMQAEGYYWFKSNLTPSGLCSSSISGSRSWNFQRAHDGAVLFSYQNNSTTWGGEHDGFSTSYYSDYYNVTVGGSHTEHLRGYVTISLDNTGEQNNSTASGDHGYTVSSNGGDSCP